MFVLCYFVEPLGHFNSTSQSCVYSDETTCIWCLRWKIPGDASALQNLCLWLEFQSRLLFVISLLLKKLFDSRNCRYKGCSTLILH